MLTLPSYTPAKFSFYRLDTWYIKQQNYLHHSTLSGTEGSCMQTT